MPIVYHGTSRTFSVAMAGTAALGTIDVSIGRGEFGQGFYTQSSSGNAYRRAQSLYGSNESSILIFDIDDVAYYALNLQHLSLNMAQMLNASVRNNNTQGVYTTQHDAIVGPLVYQPQIEQQKFQSVDAQALLNGVQTQRTVQ